MAKYDKGDVVRVTGSFWASDPSVLTDPTDSDGSWADGIYESVNVYQKKPDGTTTNLETSINRLSTGKYYVDVTLDQVGTHTVKFEGTSGVVGTETVAIEVEKSVFDHS